MNYTRLEASYWANQGKRVEALRELISAKSEVIPGRVIPDDDSLAIGSGRRLDLAVMFLDICSFSTRSNFTNSEQTTNLRVLNLFFSEMIKISEDYDATVEKNTGDGLLAYFENSHGTSASQKAVACALTMFAANDYLINSILKNSEIPELSFRVSVDYGPVTIGLLGAPRRFNSIVAIGTPANFAAKMLSNAKAGDLVLGEQAKLQLPSVWQTQYTELALMDTGWTYSVSQLSYPLYRYTGRWTNVA